MEAREIERHYEVVSRAKDTRGEWLDFKIRAILHFPSENKTELTVKPMQGEKFWFERSDPRLVFTIASMIANVAKDCMDNQEVITHEQANSRNNNGTVGDGMRQHNQDQR